MVRFRPVVAGSHETVTPCLHPVKLWHVCRYDKTRKEGMRCIGREKAHRARYSSTYHCKGGVDLCIRFGVDLHLLQRVVYSRRLSVRAPLCARSTAAVVLVLETIGHCTHSPGAFVTSPPGASILPLYRPIPVRAFILTFVDSPACSCPILPYVVLSTIPRADTTKPFNLRTNISLLSNICLPAAAVLRA